MLANPREGIVESKKNVISLTVGKVEENGTVHEIETRSEAVVLILGAGRVCRPAVEFLTSVGLDSSKKWLNSFDMEEKISVHVIVASLFLKDAEEVSLMYWLFNLFLFYFIL